MPKRRNEIELTPAEQTAMLNEAHTIQICSNGHDGYPHVVAMWYAVVEGNVCFSTYGQSQKILNLRRDNRVTALAELGEAYNELRGVAIKGRAEIVEVGTPERERLEPLFQQAMAPRYGGSGTGGLSPKRVIVKIVPDSTYSWDHRKLPTGVH